jgi:hypothetical protein
MVNNEDEHEITEREKRGWQSGAKPRKQTRPSLTTKQRIIFLKIVAQLGSSSEFERKLGLNSSDVEFYKREFNIESQDDARRLYKRLEIEHIEGREEMIMAESDKAREAEAIANRRLQELELRRAVEKREKPSNKPDANDIRTDDAARQGRFNASQKEDELESLTGSGPWLLPLEGSDAENRALVERFRRDIVNCGMVFCTNKYHALPLQIKAEATRLGLKIHWDRIKR